MGNNTSELQALLEYLIKHNADHADEIVELAAQAKELGSVEAHDQLNKGVATLLDANESLKAALATLRG